MQHAMSPDKDQPRRRDLFFIFMDLFLSQTAASLITPNAAAGSSQTDFIVVQGFSSQ